MLIAIWDDSCYIVLEAYETGGTPILIGYARTSTVEQVAGLRAQERDLAANGCERTFSEQVSSVGERPQLEAAITFLREGDQLVVTKLDRLARSVRDFLEITDRLRRKAVELRVLGLGIDTATPTGKLILNVLAGIGQFERELLLERQLEGIAKAKAAGKYRGRQPTALARADQVHAMRALGLGASAIARKLGIGRASVYRILAA